MAEHEGTQEFSLNKRQMDFVGNQLREGRDVPDEIRAAYNRQFSAIDPLTEPVKVVAPEVTPVESEPVVVQEQGNTEAVKVDEAEVLRRKQIAEDLDFTLQEVPKEILKDTTKNIEYREKLSEAKMRLKDEGVDVDAFLRKDLVIKSKEDLDILGKRKKDLKETVRAMKEGEILTEDQQKIVELTGIKSEDLSKTAEPAVVVTTESATPTVVVEQREPGEEQPWERSLAIIESRNDPAIRKEMRLKWVQEHLEDRTIPFAVINEQSEKLDTDSAAIVASQKRERTEQNEEAAREAAENKETKFTSEEEAKIILECFNLVFTDPQKRESDILRSLVDSEGFIKLKLRPGEDIHLSKELLEKIKKLDLGSWIDMRDTVGFWDTFKGQDEIVPNKITKDLFMNDSTEEYFAIGKSLIPEVDPITGRVELIPMDMGKEVGAAMKTLRTYFEGVEYWGLIGADLKQKEQLYTNLNLNRYVGEAAFSLLLSYQMLTDTSSDDYMSMMVQQDKARTKKYTKAAAGDANVRRLVQDELKNGSRIFKDPLKKAEDSAVMTEKLRKLLPNQLIPTGLSNGGMEALMAGHWPTWRYNNLYTAAEIGIDRAAGRTARAANDNDSRLLMMRSALDILLAMKAVVDPKSEIKDLADLTSKFYALVNGSVRDANGLVKDPVTGAEMVPAEMCFPDANGVLRPMTPTDWVSRNMLSVSETFLYTHSAVDHLNLKPWDMFTFAQMLRRYMQLRHRRRNRCL